MLPAARTGTFFVVLLATSAAHAQDPAPADTGTPAPPTPAAPTTPETAADEAGTEKAAAPTPAKQPVPALAPERRTSPVPKPVETPTGHRAIFEAEPVRDAAVIAISLGFAGILDLIQTTGEIRPQQISPSVSSSDLFILDRFAVKQTFSENFSTYSNWGLYAAMGYAALDPILSGVREKNVQSGIVDGVIYAEALAVTAAVTNLAKIAVRRPRPRAYAEAELHKDDPQWSSSDTDSALSFFSGHTSMTAAATATATYLAFARSPRSARPWVTLIAGTLITGVVGVGRVRSGAHFPTDVIAGAMAGAGIGVLVPHFHRGEEVKQRPVWIGFAPTPGGGGTLTYGGLF